MIINSHQNQSELFAAATANVVFVQENPVQFGYHGVIDDEKEIGLRKTSIHCKTR